MRRLGALGAALLGTVGLHSAAAKGHKPKDKHHASAEKHKGTKRGPTGPTGPTGPAGGGSGSQGATGPTGPTGPSAGAFLGVTTASNTVSVASHASGTVVATCPSAGTGERIVATGGGGEGIARSR